jgi:fluoroquinolone transport system permease protein
VQVVIVRPLIRPIGKALNWYAILWSFVLALLIVWWLGQGSVGVGDVVLSLRLGALCLAAGMAFVLDDPTEESTCMTPVSLLIRRVVRISLTLPVVAAAWLLLGRVAEGSRAATAEIPPWPFALELLAFIAVALAGAAVGNRHLSDRLGGTMGAGTALLVATAAALLPGKFRLWHEMPGTSGYTNTAKWWWAIVLAGGLVLVHYSRVGARVRYPIEVR